MYIISTYKNQFLFLYINALRSEIKITIDNSSINIKLLGLNLTKYLQILYARTTDED